MRTVWLDTKCYSFTRSKQSGSRMVKDKLTAADYSWFVKYVDSTIKRQNQLEIKPMLDRAGFIFSPVTWKWTIKKDTYEFSLWLRLSFEDTNKEGKTAFMNRIKSTGLLKYSTITKNYG